MDRFWEKTGWELHDRHLSGIASAPFQRSFPQIKLETGLWMIRGPRQVGKSTWLKTLLSQYIQVHGSNSKAFYLSCEPVRDYQELLAILNSLIDTHGLIMLDEITFVKDWSRAIKNVMDRGYKGSIVVTGSHAVDLRRGGDTMPGRWGAGKELLLLPMTFDEFLIARAEAKWPQLTHEEALRAYFRTGGFPTSVIEGGPDANGTSQSQETYQRWLSGDITRLNKREIFLREMMGQIALTMGTPISLQKLAQRTQIGSHHTVLEYIETLEDCFALRTLYAMDPNTHTYQFRKEKKFYFTDPLIYQIALSWSGFSVKGDHEPVLAEMVAAEHLMRHAKSNNERIGYLSSPKGEIDFIGASGWALEVKWSPHQHNLSKAFNAFPGSEKIVWNQYNLLQNLPLR